MTKSSRWAWVVGGLMGLLVVAVPLPIHSPAPTQRTFRIQASRFEYSQPVLSVNPGDRVTIELTAEDVVHGLSIDGYNLEMTADPGQTSRLTFTAGHPGAYRFRCSVTCGNLHPFMIGKLYVGPNTLLWRAFALAALVGGLGAWRLWK